MSLSLVTPPTEEPISVDELRTHLRLEGADDSENSLLSGLIEAARLRVETETRRQVVTATYDMFLDEFPQRKASDDWGVDSALPPQDREFGRKLSLDAIEFPLPPLQSVVSVQYLDGNEDLQTVSSSVYRVDAVSEPGRVIPAPDSFWPVGTSRVPNAVQIRFIAGYGDASEVPASVKVAIKELCGHWYENREAVSAVRLMEIPLGISAILAPNRWGSYV